MKILLTSTHVPRSTKVLVSKVKDRYEKVSMVVWLFVQVTCFPFVVNSFLTDDNTKSFCGQCGSRSDCTECAV